MAFQSVHMNVTTVTFSLFSLQVQKHSSMSLSLLVRYAGVYRLSRSVQITAKGVEWVTEREREREGRMCLRQRGTSLSLWWQQHLGCENVTTVAAQTESQCELEMTRRLPGGFIRER